MHPCFSVDENLKLLARGLVALEAGASAVALACCCKSFEGPVLDVLWEIQDQLIPLLKCFPEDIWEEEDGRFSFRRIPTKAEWIHSRKHAQRMRKLTVDVSEDPVTPDILLALQLRAVNDHWLPKLETFECEEAEEGFIPFIPLFLSPLTTEIDIRFDEDTPVVVIASMISRFSTLCPNLECITLHELPRDPVITEAVSEMVLACNRNTLRRFHVDSPLTEEAQQVVYRLPRLFSLWAVIQRPTSLPTVELPNLTRIDLEYDHHLNWLQGFLGVALEKLEIVAFHSESEQIGDFLEAFEAVALTTSVQNTLLELGFYTSRSWNPNYSSLLSFNQLKELEIEFSCNGGCSSRVDDDIIISLAGAMPNLEILRLGKAPCKTPTGVTVNGLIGLACRCPQLSNLRVHFQAISLADAATGVVTSSLSGDEPVARREDCALRVLEVGETHIPMGSASTVAIILLQIFPRLLNVRYTNRKWKAVAKTIKEFRRIRAFVNRSRDAIDAGFPSEDGRA